MKSKKTFYEITFEQAEEILNKNPRRVLCDIQMTYYDSTGERIIADSGYRTDTKIILLVNTITKRYWSTKRPRIKKNKSWI